MPHEGRENMARREEITYGEVAEICDRLKTEKKKPSIRLIIVELGGGSATTVSKFLKKWIAAQSIKPTIELSAALQDSIHKEIASHIKASEDVLREQISSLQALLDEHHDISGKHEEEIEKLLAASVELTQQLNTEKIIYLKLQEQVAGLEKDKENLSNKWVEAEKQIAANSSKLVEQDKYVKHLENTIKDMEQKLDRAEIKAGESQQQLITMLSKTERTDIR